MVTEAEKIIEQAQKALTPEERLIKRQVEEIKRLVRDLPGADDPKQRALRYPERMTQQ